MELRKGMYVITNDRMKIGKIKDFCTCKMCEKRGFYEPIIDGDIIITDYNKSQSYHGYKFYDNLIDLIEVGDYVNGKRVVDKWEEPDWYGYFIKLEGETEIPTIRNIKSIVTKEQFENMAYEAK